LRAVVGLERVDALLRAPIHRANHIKDAMITSVGHGGNFRTASLCFVVVGHVENVGH
jgi:hypothetical protein